MIKNDTVFEHLNETYIAYGYLQSFKGHLSVV